MKTNKFIRTILASALVMVLLASLGFAQTSKGSIGGTVTDATDAVIVGATVTAKNVDTGDVRSTKTGANGQYRIDSVELGTYNVTVNQTGFTPLTVQKITVSGSVVTSVNAKLKIGTSESIVVEATNAAVQTETGEMSGVIAGKEVSDTPIPSLNPYALATTLPGVSTVTTGSDFTNGTSYSSDGSRPRSNNFMIEGQDNNDSGIHGQGLQPQNLESIQEVSVLLNSTSAEYGHGGGAIANVIYKSGTNNFHGTVWDRLKNSSLDSNDHYNKLEDVQLEKNKYRENLFGFNLGGPIKKDKLFFFGSYQWDKYRSSSSSSALYLPTQAGYNTLANFASNPRIAAMLAAYGNLRGNPNSTISIYHLGLDPVSGVDRGSIPVGQYYRTGVPLNTDSPELNVKGDYLVTKKDTINLRLIRSSFTAPYDFFNNSGVLPGFDTQQSGTSYNAGVTYTHVFSPTLLNEARASYGRIGFWFLPRTDDVAAMSGPGVSVGGFQGWGSSSLWPQGRFHNTYQLQDSMSWTKGKHFVKFGFDFAQIRVVDTVPMNISGAISYGKGGGYDAIANYLDDYSGASANVSKTFGSQLLHVNLFSQNYFIQDSWKVRPNLTLDLGFRYEYNGAPANQMKYPAVNLNNVACYNCVVHQAPDGADVAPRLSFAYTPRFWNSLFGDGKTVIRGGFGIFYDSMFTNILDNNQSTSPNAAASALTTNSNMTTRRVANWSTYFGNLSTTPTATATSNVIVPHLLSPETLQWNLNIQRELPAKFTLEIGYVGTRGEHLYANTFLNPYTEAGPRLFSNRGTIVLRDNSGDSIYHGVHAQLERKYSNGLQFRGSYTFSKMIDDAAEVYTSGTSNNGAGGNWSGYSIVQYPAPRGTYDRSVSGFDHKQRFTFTYIYDIPKLKNSDTFTKTLGYITNGWQISGTTAFQSGTPYNVETGFDSNGDGVSNDRPNLGNAKAPLQTYAVDRAWVDGGTGLCDGPTWWNTNDPCKVVSANSVHWVVPASGLGTFGRNGIIGPWYQQWSFSVARNIKIHESHSLQFRADLFNPFNNVHKDGDFFWPSYTLASGIQNPTGNTDPNNTFGSTTFGDYKTSQHGYRNIHLLLKYSF